MSDQLDTDIAGSGAQMTEPAAKPRRRSSKPAGAENDSAAQARSSKGSANRRRSASDKAKAEDAPSEQMGEEKASPRRRQRRPAPEAQPETVEAVTAGLPAASQAPAMDGGKGRRRFRSRAVSPDASPSGAEPDAPSSDVQEGEPSAQAKRRFDRRRRENAPDGAASEPVEVPADPAPAGDSSDDVPKGPRRRHYERRENPSPRRRTGSSDPEPAGDAEAAPKAQQQRDQYSQNRFQRERASSAPAQKQREQRAFAAGQQGGKRANKDRRQSREIVQPQTSREDVGSMSVSVLREKAAELGIDPVGLKKSELSELVYRELVKQEGFFEFRGILDIGSDGTGYIRTKSYLPSEGDVYVASGAIRANGLRRGDEVVGVAHAGRQNDKYAGLNRIVTVNGRAPEGLAQRARFGDLTPVFPTEPLKMEHGKDSILGRCIDIVAPIGKGQRGLIVSPPKAGKTTVLKKIAESIATNNPEVHLICLLVDERPEEVTDMQRSIKGEVVASTFDMPSDNHITVSELVIERAKRLVELGEDVVILLDSITRLARAYNLAQPASGRILSGGVDSTALYPPKRFLGAARNIEGGGSLTILASALVDTGSKMDEVIFEEFKGTGNMELKLDRDLADRRIFPAIDPVTSGTRKEELLLDPGMAPFIWGIRRILANMNSNERAMSSLIKSLKATQNNEEFLIRSAKKAQLSELNAEI